MVNIEDFIKRLEIILDYYSLSASAFADKVGVQRSSLSHLLSGRNKPSLDLILKIVSEFPEVDLYWIVNGNGTFPKSENQNIDNKMNPISQNLNTEFKTGNQSELFTSDKSLEKNSVQEILEDKISNTRFSESGQPSQDIDRIVIFYKNGSFKSYTSTSSV